MPLQSGTTLGLFRSLKNAHFIGSGERTRTADLLITNHGRTLPQRVRTVERRGLMSRVVPDGGPLRTPVPTFVARSCKERHSAVTEGSSLRVPIIRPLGWLGTGYHGPPTSRHPAVCGRGDQRGVAGRGAPRGRPAQGTSRTPSQRHPARPRRRLRCGVTRWMSSSPILSRLRHPSGRSSAGTRGPHGVAELVHPSPPACRGRLSRRHRPRRPRGPAGGAEYGPGPEPVRGSPGGLDARVVSGAPRRGRRGGEPCGRVRAGNQGDRDLESWVDIRPKHGNTCVECRPVDRNPTASSSCKAPSTCSFCASWCSEPNTARVSREPSSGTLTTSCWLITDRCTRHSSASRPEAGSPPAGATSANNRKARFYTLTRTGRRQLTTETAQWQRLVAAVSRVLGPDEV